MVSELSALHSLSSIAVVPKHNWTNGIYSWLNAVWHKTDRGVHAGVADLNNAADMDVDEVDGSALDATGDTASSMEILQSKSNIRKNKNLKRKEMNRFHHTMRVVNIMFRYSSIHKAWLIPASLAATLILPESVMEMASPVFAALGVHIGVKASRNLQELIHKIRHPHHVAAAEKHEHTLSKIVEKNRKADLATTAEITGALLELIRNQPMLPKITIMTTYGIGMPAILYGVTWGLLGLEHYGYGLKNNGQEQLCQAQNKNALVRGWAKTKIGLGHTFIGVPRVVFGAVVPWLTIGAQFYTSGRTITHAIAPAAAMSQRLFGTDNLVAWTCASVVTTAAVRTAFALAQTETTKRVVSKVLVAPANKIIEKTPVLKEWKQQAQSAVTATRKTIERQRKKDSTLSDWGQNLKRAVYTPYLFREAKSRLSKLAA